MAHTPKTTGSEHTGGRSTQRFAQKAKRMGLAPAGENLATKRPLWDSEGNAAGCKVRVTGPSGNHVWIIGGAFTGADVVHAVRCGLPVTAVDEIVQSGSISNAEINHLVLPRRTLANRRAVGTLTADQSDKLVRVARVISKAESTFGNPEKAHRWLRRPTAPLNGETPLQLLDTEAGARLVEDLLVRIDHGIAA
jgi:putative toxin-antitoxin system antitoxin component (TIGR02293 family)